MIRYGELAEYVNEHEIGEIELTHACSRVDEFITTLTHSEVVTPDGDITSCHFSKRPYYISSDLYVCFCDLLDAGYYLLWAMETERKKNAGK